MRRLSGFNDMGGPLAMQQLCPHGTGQSKYSLSFSAASSEKVTVSASTSYGASASGCTVAAWVKLGTLTGTFEIVLEELSTDNGHTNKGIRFAGNSTAPTVLFGSGGSEHSVTAAASIGTGTWAHVAGTFDGSTITCYVNGVASGTPLSVSGTQEASTSAVGIAYRVSSNNLFLNGQLDDVGIWLTALTPTQIAGLAAGTTNPANLSPAALWRFEEGSGTSTADSSGNGNTGTLVNSPTWSTDVPSQLM